MRTTCLRRSRCSTADISPAASYETLESGHRLQWAEVVTICKGQMAALCRSSSLLPSPRSSVLCFAGLLLSASSPPCGRGKLFVLPTRTAAAWDAGSGKRLAARKGRAEHAHNYLFWREVEADLFGAQIRCLLCRKGDGSWPRKREEAAARAAPWGAGGQEERSRGGGGTFHSQALIVLSEAGRGCLWERTGNRARFPCARPWGLFLFTPDLASLPSQPNCQIVPLPSLQAGLVGFTVTKAYLLVIWLHFQAG